MYTLIAVWATLSAVAPFAACWHGYRTGDPPQATTHRYPPAEWQTMRLAAGGW
jgi:hypothetical protein